MGGEDCPSECAATGIWLGATAIGGLVGIRGTSGPRALEASELHLPNEILENIVRHIEDTPTLLALCLSSRALHDISVLYLFRRISVRGRLCVQDRWTPVSAPPESQVQLMETMSTNRDVSYATCVYPRVEKFVRELQLAYYDQRDPRGVGPECVTMLVDTTARMIMNCENVEHLQVCAAVVLRPRLVEAILSLRKLKHLLLYLNYNVDDFESLSGLPPLSSLQVSFQNITQVYDGIMDALHLTRKILQTSSKTLNALYIHGACEGLGFLSEMPREEVGPVVFGGMRCPPRDSEFAKTIPWKPVTTLENLEKLVLHYLMLDAETLQRLLLAIDFSKLTYLELSRCRGAGEILCLDMEWTHLKGVCVEAYDLGAAKTLLRRSRRLEEIFLVGVQAQDSDPSLSDLIGIVCGRHGHTLKSLTLKPAWQSPRCPAGVNGFSFRKLVHGCKHLTELRLAYDFDHWYDLVHTIHHLPRLETLIFENAVSVSIPLYNYSLSHPGLRYTASAKTSTPRATCPSQRACERGIASIVKSYLLHSPPDTPPPIRCVSMMRMQGANARWYYDVGPGVESEEWGCVDSWIGFHCVGVVGGGWRCAKKGVWRMENGGGESEGNLVGF